MGPTGTPTETPARRPSLLVGGGLGNAVLFSIGAEAARKRIAACSISPATRRSSTATRSTRSREAADVVVWCCDEAPGFTPGRAQDRAFVGNIVQAMDAYAHGRARRQRDSARMTVDRVIAIGSDGMMGAVAQARHTVLKPYLKPDHHAIGSINSPMQCMMKEICAQCLQLHNDPVTGEETLVFSCFNQDQPLDHVDFARAARTALAEQRAGKTDRAMDRALPRRVAARSRCRVAPRSPATVVTSSYCERVVSSWTRGRFRAARRHPGPAPYPCPVVHVVHLAIFTAPP